MTKTVMATGSFDILHPGHLLYLKKARSLGDRLIVVVARDRSIELLKKRKPFFSEKERLATISSLKMVDKAVLGNKIKRREDTFAILKKYKPDIIAMGYDQKPSVTELAKWLEKNGMKTKVVRIKSSEDPKKYKSSKIRKALFS